MDPNWLFRPLSYDEFKAKYFERDVCVLHRKTPNYYGNLLTIGDLDTIFTTHRVSHPEIALVQKDKDIPTPSYTAENGRIDTAKAARFVAQGATIVFTQLQSRLPELGRLCAELESLFSQRMQTNIYLTPADAQGFDPHWDTHDVFVLQISGTKHWTIYDTQIELPLRGQSWNNGDYKAGPVSNEFEIGPGDMVYIPRGVIHSAKSSSETSLHITTGLMGSKWTDLILQAVAAAATEEKSLRESLPLGWARDDNTVDLDAMYRERIATLFARIKAAPPPFAELTDELKEHYGSLSSGLLKRSVDATAISPSTVVRLPAGTGWELHNDDEACYIRAGAKELRLPARALPILQSFKHHGTARIADLPGAIDDAGKLVLVRRLITEGLLECA